MSSPTATKAWSRPARHGQTRSLLKVKWGFISVGIYFLYKIKWVFFHRVFSEGVLKYVHEVWNLLVQEGEQAQEITEHKGTTFSQIGGYETKQIEMVKSQQDDLQ